MVFHVDLYLLLPAVAIYLVLSITVYKAVIIL